MKRRKIVFLTMSILLVSFPAWAAAETLYIGAKKSMKATVFTPEGAGQFADVVVLHTSGGLQDGDLNK